MLKILHLADVHLDTVFGSRSGGVRKRLRDSIRGAFVRAVDLAISERLDAVLIAGDLFDGDTLSFTTEKLIIEQVRRLSEAGIRGFYATGNHDPASMRARVATFDWPDGFHVFRSAEPESVEIRSPSGELRAVIVGAGHETAREERNLASGFPVADGPIPHVGLLHTVVASAASAHLHDRYAPCEVSDLRRTRYDYWALGHVHARQLVDERSNAWYPGNLLGRNPKEPGARGALIAHVERGKPAATEFVPLAGVEWVHLVLDELGSTTSTAELETEVRDRFAAQRQKSVAEDWLVVLDLEGPCPMEPDLRDAERRQELEELIADSLQVMEVEIRTDRLRSPVDVDAFRGKPHLLGETLAVLAELRHQDKLLAELAPQPLEHRLKTDDERLEYLKSLLDGLEDEAVRRLVAEDGGRK